MSSKLIEEIFGVHAARAALKNPRRKIHSLICTQDFYDRYSQDLKNKKIGKIQILKRKEMDTLFGFNTHQGIFLKCNFLQNYKITAIEKDEKIILILDSLNDSQNVGSILRTAYLFGVKTIIYNKDNSFKLSSFMIKSASGSYENIKMIEVTNLNKTIDFLKKNEFWIIGLDSNSNDTVNSISNNIKKVLILGSEDKGIRMLVKKNCDFVVRIETVVKKDAIVDSLNVSNACAIILNQLTNKNETTT
ncbi:MAG: 23S rRNA (guanosine(2251)-2'-O)-methyltransferase RlmB [Rickettsiales bacterium]|nr:23S rRNA (guanosine(2251)-2'-O)-methyltransferase RlmB [Rickettsiales bacterium]|tara:strand:+ start:108 stop:848 length:741 start_codon:yes stop_codon:yes gene_type:complete